MFFNSRVSDAEGGGRENPLVTRHLTKKVTQNGQFVKSSLHLSCSSYSHKSRNSEMHEKKQGNETDDNWRQTEREGGHFVPDNGSFLPPIRALISSSLTRKRDISHSSTNIKRHKNQHHLHSHAHTMSRQEISCRPVISFNMIMRRGKLTKLLVYNWRTLRSYCCVCLVNQPQSSHIDSLSVKESISRFFEEIIVKSNNLFCPYFWGLQHCHVVRNAQ